MLSAPIRGVMWLARQLEAMAAQELMAEEEAALRELQALHRALEAGRLDEAAFDRAEARLLCRIEAIHTALNP